MVATEQILGPSAGAIPAPAFDPQPETSRPDLDKAIGRLRENARRFARASIPQKIAWLRDVSERIERVAPEWTDAACRAKGLDRTSTLAGEEWLGGPWVTLRSFRQLIQALRDVQAHGAPQLEASRIRELPNGAVAVGVSPYDGFDKALNGKLSGETWLLPGARASDVQAHQASFYRKKDPEGGVSLVLGAGNVSSIPPMDLLYKMFVEGNVCILKMNPVNEYLGPFFERIFEPLVKEGFVTIVYGGADVGSYLCYHDAIDDVHITGSDKTHDVIVWGPAGPERERRKRENDPILKKKITSELGNVSPVLVPPGPYDDRDIAVMAENVAGMVTNNASFNCNAAKMIITAKGWKDRDRFLQRLTGFLAAVPPRKAYYPGAKARWRALTEGHADVRTFGSGDETTLPWTVVAGLDADRTDETNFTTEPFCSIISQTEVGSVDPVEFFATATTFANDRLWGTLNAMLFAHPEHETDPTIRGAIDACIRDLRYGTVGVNQWPAVAYALGTTPWGGHPSASLSDIQSGLGWVHNSVMLENIEKCVVRAGLRPFPKPVWFPTHSTLRTLGEKLVAFEGSPSWLKIPGLAITAMRA